MSSSLRERDRVGDALLAYFPDLGHLSRAERAAWVRIQSRRDVAGRLARFEATRGGQRVELGSRRPGQAPAGRAFPGQDGRRAPRTTAPGRDGIPGRPGAGSAAGSLPSGVRLSAEQQARLAEAGTPALDAGVLAWLGVKVTNQDVHLVAGDNRGGTSLAVVETAGGPVVPVARPGDDAGRRVGSRSVTAVEDVTVQGAVEGAGASARETTGVENLFLEDVRARRERTQRGLDSGELGAPTEARDIEVDLTDLEGAESEKADLEAGRVVTHNRDQADGVATTPVGRGTAVPRQRRPSQQVTGPRNPIQELKGPRQRPDLALV